MRMIVAGIQLRTVGCFVGIAAIRRHYILNADAAGKKRIGPLCRHRLIRLLNREQRKLCPEPHSAAEATTGLTVMQFG